MTQNLYLNIIYSIRDFLTKVDNTIPWYLDEVSTMNEDTFVEVITSVHRIEDDTMPYVTDYINANVYAREDVESVIGKIISNLENRAIPIYDFIGDSSKIGTIMIDRYETTFIGSEAGYRIANVSIYYKIIE